MASKDFQMSKQGAAGKRKHATLTTLQKLEIIVKIESGNMAVWLWRHTIPDRQLPMI